MAFNIPIPIYSIPIPCRPIPNFLTHFHFRGIPECAIPIHIGNPIPMHISSTESVYCTTKRR